MAIPTSYTEETLAAYMAGFAGPYLAGLGLEAADFGEAVNETLAAYGVTDIALATDTAKLRAIARYQALAALELAAGFAYDFGADGGNYKRSQIRQPLKDAMARAWAELAAYGIGGAGAILLGNLEHASWIGDELTQDDNALKIYAS